MLLVTADRSGPVVTALGGWAPPVGIALVADRLSALLLLVSTLVALAVLVYAISQRIADFGRRMASSTFYPMYLVLSAGVSLAYLSGDLFTLFVSFEIMLTASYVLITRRTTTQTIRAGMTYVTVSLLSSLLFLTAVGMVYAATATVNLADLSERVQTLPPGLRTVLAAHARRGVRDQGGDGAAALLAARQLPERSRAGHRAVRRAAHQGQLLRDGAHADPAVPARRVRGR